MERFKRGTRVRLDRWSSNFDGVVAVNDLIPPGSEGTVVGHEDATGLTFVTWDHLLDAPHSPPSEWVHGITVFDEVSVLADPEYADLDTLLLRVRELTDRLASVSVA